jgi:hypothetical protein
MVSENFPFQNVQKVYLFLLPRSFNTLLMSGHIHLEYSRQQPTYICVQLTHPRLSVQKVSYCFPSLVTLQLSWRNGG